MTYAEMDAPRAAEGAPSSPSDAPPAYSVSAVLKGASLDNLHMDSVDTIRRSACFKQAVLGGTLVAALLAAHRFKEGGSRLRCANDAFLGFLGVFQVQWYMCRRDETERREGTRRFYAKQMATQGWAPPSSSPPAPGEAATRKLADLTAYSLPTVEEGPSRSVTTLQ
jgi:hypothetical protein